MLRRLTAAALPAGLRTKLRLMREARQLRAFRAYEVQRRYAGDVLAIHIADPTAQRWYDHDWEFPGELAFLRTNGYLRPGSTVFEIGAHQGVVALIVGRLVGPEGRVIAVEASRHNATVAERNVRRNLANNIEILHAAASDRAGSLAIDSQYNAHTTSGANSEHQVSALTVDQLSREKGPPETLFVDVEGYEIHVLRGARATIQDHRPAAFVEIHSGGRGLEQYGSADDVIRCFPATYSFYVSPVDTVNFRPIGQSRELLETHSFLVALPNVSSFSEPAQ